MSKEIEKYVGLYLLVYIVVLAVCGFFQYMAVCQGKSLACAFDIEGMNTIITTTAYVLTPIIAIVALESWRTKHNKSILSSEAKEAYQGLYDLKNYFNIMHKIALIGNPDYSIQELKEKIIEELKDCQIKSSKISEKVKFITDLTEDNDLIEANRRYQIKFSTISQKIKFDLALNQPKSFILENSMDGIQTIVDLNYLLREELKKYILV